jgi:chromosome partitioning protein
MCVRANARGRRAHPFRRSSVKTIALAAAKGGVGKTTLTAALAVAASLARPGTKVGIADLDPQGSLTQWWNLRARAQPLLASIEGRPLRAARRDLRADGFGWLFLDCPPGFSSVLREAIAAADLVLVPVGASALDVAAVASTAEMARSAGAPYRFVLNRAVCRSRLAGQAAAALRELGPLLRPLIHQRVTVAAAMATGDTAIETDPASVAAAELGALWRSVSDTLDGIRAVPRLSRATGGC